MNILENALKNKKSKKPIKLKSISIPKTIELNFYRQLQELANQMKEYTRKYILPELESSSQETQIKDSLPQLLFSINKMNSEFGNIVTFSNMANSLINSLSRSSKEKTIQSIQSRIGVNISSVLNEAKVRNMEDLMKLGTTTMIKSIPEEFIKNISQIVNNGIAQGLRHEEIARQIKGINNISSAFGKLENRVKLIARNEVGTINSNLTKARYESVGLDLYEWSTSGDDEVRDAHRALDGKICKFSDPSVYADSIEDARNGIWKSRSSIGGYIGSVGTDYNCRCVAIPIVLN